MFFSVKKCHYKGATYQEGETWTDGCDYECECIDGQTGRYTCSNKYYITNTILTNLLISYEFYSHNIQVLFLWLDSVFKVRKHTFKIKYRNKNKTFSNSNSFLKRVILHEWEFAIIIYR